MKKQAIIQAYKAFRIKKYKPKICTIAFVRTNLPEDNQLIEIIREGFDTVILNDLTKLIQLIKRPEREFQSKALLNP